MPKPADNESEQDFVSRCIRQVMDDGTTDDPKQAAAICYSKWREGKSMSNKHAELLAKIKTRKGAGLRFGQGFWTADKFVSSLAECIGPGICQTNFGVAGKSFSEAVKEASGRLTYSGDMLAINEHELVTKLATSTSAMKKMLGEVDLPAHSMMAFVHTLTTPREDRDGDVLETAGAVLDSKMPLLWQHVHTLPIGRALKTIEHNEERLRLASVLLDLNPLTSDAAKLLEAGALRFSHGFRALDFSERNKEVAGAPGFRVKSYEIMEESLVSVPSNIDAEVELLSRGKLKSPVFVAHAKAMQRALPKKHAGVAMPAAKAGDNQINAGTAKSGAHGTDTAAGNTTDAAGGHQHAKHPYGFCPTCKAPGKARERRLDGNDVCENGHKYPSKSALADCGCGCGGTGKCGDAKTKAAMERDTYGTFEEATARATELGCTGAHQVMGDGGAIRWRPCYDPYSLSVYQPGPGQPNVSTPAGHNTGSTSADAGSQKAAALTGQKVYIDSGSLRGSYYYRQSELSKDALRYLMSSGIDVGRDDYAHTWALFDDYGIISLCRSMMTPDNDGGERYFRAQWQEVEGEPSWTGVPMEVEVASTIQINETGKAHLESCVKSLESAMARMTNQKVGRTLSQANIDKLNKLKQDLAAIASGDVTPAVSALAERCQRVVEDVLSSAVPIEDNDPQPKSSEPSGAKTPSELSLDSAAAVVLTSAQPSDANDVALLKRLRDGIDGLLLVAQQDQKAAEFKKLLRR